MIADHQLISSVPPWLAVQGLPIEQIYYASANDVNGGLGLAVSPRQPAESRAAARSIDRSPCASSSTNSTSFEVDGHVAVAGEVIGHSDYCAGHLDRR